MGGAVVVGKRKDKRNSRHIFSHFASGRKREKAADDKPDLCCAPLTSRRPQHRRRPPPSMSLLSTRVCQFFLRGRCLRENCEFSHDAASASASAANANAGSSTAAASSGSSGYASGSSGYASSGPRVCRFFQKGNCKFGLKCRSVEKGAKIPAPVLSPLKGFPKLSISQANPS